MPTDKLWLYIQGFCQENYKYNIPCFI